MRHALHIGFVIDADTDATFDEWHHRLSTTLETSFKRDLPVGVDLHVEGDSNMIWGEGTQFDASDDYPDATFHVVLFVTDYDTDARARREQAGALWRSLRDLLGAHGLRVNVRLMDYIVLTNPTDWSTEVDILTPVQGWQFAGVPPLNTSDAH